MSKETKADLIRKIDEAYATIRDLRRQVAHTREQRSHLENELINNCGAVKVEYDDSGEKRPARVLWKVDPVTGVATHNANAKYAAEVQARAVKAESKAKNLAKIIGKLAQIVESISQEGE